MAPSRQPTLKKCCLLYPWCVFLYLLLLAFIAFISVLFWTSWRPMQPSYAIDDLSIPVLNVLLETPPTDNNVSLTIKVLNPNRAFSIHFYFINVTLKYGAKPIGNTEIRNITRLRPTQTSSIAKSFTVDRKFSQVVQKLASIDGKVEVEVHLQSKCSYQFLSWYHAIHAEELYGRVPVGKDGKILEDKKINLTPRS